MQLPLVQKSWSGPARAKFSKIFFLSGMAVSAQCSPWIENPLTSYRIGKSRNSKIPPTYKTETPRNTPSNTSRNAQKIQLVFGVYFSGIFSVYSRSLAAGVFGCRGGIFDLFWGLGGFLLCS